MVFGQSSLRGLFRATGLKSPIDRMTRCHLGADLLGGKVGWATIGIAHGTSVATMVIKATVASRDAVGQGATRVHHKGGFVGADFAPLARRAILKESRGGYSRRHKDQDAKN